MTEEQSDDTSPTLSDVPLVILVTNSELCEGFDKLEEVVFKKENVGLAMKAFRALRMSPSDVEKDPLLKESGSETPRLLVFDPAKKKVTVIEKGKMTSGALFSAMKKVADPFFGIDLDKKVKDHLKLLTERDQLANRVKVLEDKKTRTEKEKDLAEIQKERDEVNRSLEEISTKEQDLWKLSKKGTAS